MTGKFVKPVNAVIAGYSYIKSSLTGNVSVAGMPAALSVELTNHCNLHCPECLSGSGLMKRGRGYMDTGLFRRVMSELRPYIFNLNLYFQGEPMLHPQFFSFLENCPEVRKTVSTNGHFLSEENTEKLVRSTLSKLVISLDGLDQETYSKYRKEGNLNAVLNGIKNITSAKDKYGSSLKLEIQFLVSRNNEHQIAEVKRFAHEINASFKLKSMQIRDKRDMEYWLPSGKKFSRYKKIDGYYVIRNSMPDRCARLWFNPVITWDGKVVPCCFDKDAEHVMGDLNRDSFRDIWNGTRYRIFRKSILSGRYMTEICRNCTSGMKWGINH